MKHGYLPYRESSRFACRISLLVSVTAAEIGEGRWHVFNDFAVAESTRAEATNFTHAFKQPCLLFYSRADLHRAVPVPPPVAPIAQMMFAEQQLSVNRQQQPQRSPHAAAAARPRAFANLHSLGHGASLTPPILH
jgi:hypothetical protein